MSRQIELERMTTVGDLADRLDLPSTTLIKELFKNGVMVTINEKIDFDTATILISELGLDVELVQKQGLAGKGTVDSDSPKKVLSKSSVPRPPVVSVMGHVDHGKTSLLDKIRGTNVVDKEAGGITQHISAYQIEFNDRRITFMDTPGHEAFAAIRQHGAVLTDLAVIVVAADDGIKPQTLEAIRYAKNAGIKMIFAANKVDKEAADVNRLKQQLAEQNILAEDWGGDAIVVPVSAKTGEGLDKLLEMILLVADMEDLVADPEAATEGMVIEARMEKGLGPVTSVLVGQGRLRKGDFVQAGSAYGKVRVMSDSNGNEIECAEPASPVIVSGFKTLPDFGSNVRVFKSEKAAQKAADDNRQDREVRDRGMTGSELLRIMSRRSQVNEYNVWVKADVQGSLTSVIDSLKSLSSDEVAVRVVGSGVGPVSENDVKTAAASQATIYEFGLKSPSSIVRLAKQESVSVKSYKVIYELIDDVKQHLEDLLEPEEVITDLGELKVLGVFNTTRDEVICGGEVLTGNISLPAQVKIFRNKKAIAEAEVTKLQSGPQVVTAVSQGEQCGVSLKTSDKLILEENDRLKFYRTDIKQRSLS